MESGILQRVAGHGMINAGVRQLIGILFFYCL